MGGGSAQGGGGQGGSGGEPDTSELHIDSFAPTGAEAGGVFRYRVVLDQTGPASYELTAGPTGATIDANGLVTWTPSHNQVGQTHNFSVKASLGGEEATQEFEVAVTALTISAEELLDPSSELLQIISVDSPLSAAVGVTLTVPPGALSEASSISISTTAGAPAMPAQSNAGDTPFVLGFGPSGSVFNSPIDLVIPLSTSTWQRLLTGQGVATAWTLGSDGRWEALPIEHVDLDNGYIQIKLQHFSLVGLMAAPALLKLDQTDLGSTSCPSALLVKAGFTDAALSTITTNWLNGGSLGSGVFEVESALKGLLNPLPAGHSIQLLLRAVLSGADGGSEERQYRLFSVQKRADGKVDVTVTNDGGNVLHTRTELSPDSAEIDAVLHGDFTHFVFHDVPAMQDGRIALDAFAYARRPDAPSIIPGSEGQAFASLVQTFANGSLTAGGYDDDCDGIVNTADSVVTMALPPRIQTTSTTTLRTTTNTPLTLGVKVVSEAQGGAVVNWTGSTPTAMLTPDMDGLQASFVSSMPGTYKVTATAVDSAGMSSETFLVVVDSPSTPNTPPRCKINAKQTSVFTGDQIPLEALLEDDEQPNKELSVEWTVTTGASLSSRTDRRLSFGAQTPAVYDVSCIARDGLNAGQPTTLSITVFDRPQNSPPKLAFVAPASATLTIGNTGLATQQIRVTASDIDQDPVSIELTLLEGTATLSVATSPSPTGGLTYAARTFETAVPGPYNVLVRAVDQNGATSESVVVKLLVAQSIDRTDADRDGFPASVDCNDNDITVFPGALEICGDSIDQNCNGSDRAAADCDADRDGKSANDGDCDDRNPSVFPGARERCNGRDDNCNSTIDEGFIVGTTCKLGTGACAASGMNVCNLTGEASVCTAKPTAPVAETCNGIDDNCNGTVDDVPTQGAADVQNCGGCGTACIPNAHQTAACMPNSTGKLGCTFNCSPGYIDLDRNPANGCEYSCSNANKETCNGADDDCDGRVDEQTDAPVYPGPNGTLGVGDCRSGLMVCKQGVLTEVLPPITPATERCDMRDNNCDGKIDDGFTVGGSCDGPDSDLCANGRLVCGADGSIVCGLEPALGAREVCDGMDNDCNPETPDGSAESALNRSCDELNKEFCEPGHVACTGGRLLCSNEDRDRTSCKVCNCDSTSSCDTNGTGYYCACDPQCVGPDVGCPCDIGSGCDLLDGAEECGCDKECVGDTVCSCDVNATQCDTAQGGFVCACDDNCHGTCGCDANAGVCDKTPSGDACLCDNECYPSCACDDRNPSTCAKDSSGNVCQCDPNCIPGGGTCACDLTAKTCDRDSQTQTPCQCDADCSAGTCNCNTTMGCDKAASGDQCLCDGDCYAACPCDDRNPDVCARDANGNACQCDPTCLRVGNGCDCDKAAGMCDKDQAGNNCACDKDCGSSTGCTCDVSSGACDMDPNGQPCGCDRDCASPPQCTCDKDPMACDRDANGNMCLCDDLCYPMCPCMDADPTVCRKDSDGNACLCDPGCEGMGAPACSCDKTKATCDAGPNGVGICDCDVDCGATPATCGCDTSQTCNTATNGDACLCDRSCYPACPCDDNDAATCPRDQEGNVCLCDPTCQGPGGGGSCMCDASRGTCDMDANGQPCGCDVDCSASSCGCDKTKGVCDKDPNNQNCGCDPDCSAMQCQCDTTASTCDMVNGQPCSCDPACGMTACQCDTTPTTCDMVNGQPCGCDPACGMTACQCDMNKGSCDMVNGQPCGCDPDCSAMQCQCDTTASTCDMVNGQPCGCDPACSMSACQCDATPSTCDMVNGQPCGCDPDCSAMQCACDATMGACDMVNGQPCGCDRDCSATAQCACDTMANMCDKNPGGDNCLCDRLCYPSCPCADNDPMMCHRDSEGHACSCDPGCETAQPTCGCDKTPGVCDADDTGLGLCMCDIDCGAQPPPCSCDSTPNCDNAANGDACLCDKACYPTCPCDDNNPMTCARDSAGNACGCDPTCKL